MTRRLRKILTILVLGAVICPAGMAGATPINQWASTVIGYSSHYPGMTPNEWSATQALGAPDTFSYGDYVTAWAPEPMDGSLEFITLGYTTPVHATGVTIRETWGNGFVYQVDVLDTNNVYHTMWTGTDPSLPGTPANFSLSWGATSYLVAGVKIYVNTDLFLDDWEEIDAVQLSGNGNQVPLPPTVLLLGSGLLGLGLLRLRRKNAA